MVAKRGLATGFIILALVIVGSILVVYAFRESLFETTIDPEFAPIYTSYLGCIQTATEEGIEVMGVQGGRIELGDYVPGSEFAPFSSHLNFMGTPVPYWSYVTGNNFFVEQAPTKSEMEQHLEEYVAQRIQECEFTPFYFNDFYISLPASPSVSAAIHDEAVDIVVNGALVTQREGRSARKTRHEVTVESSLGALYEIARDIHEEELETAFLESYAVDTLRNHVPVDGVSVSCSPEIWQTRDEVTKLHEALATNFGAIKIAGNAYILDDVEDDYFIVDLGYTLTDASVQVLYSPRWPSITEVTPATNEIMIADPVGTQSGMGIMGFCYVPYHFVWDVRFPVMVQVTRGTEIFQFPLAVILDNNVPREAEIQSLLDNPEVDACQFYNGELTARVYDQQLAPVEGALVTYSCFDSRCTLGSTELVGSEAVYSGGIPQCINGELVVSAEGFAETALQYSSNEPGEVDIILRKEYPVDVSVLVDGQSLSGSAVISFDDGRNVVTASLPELESVTLHEGEYDVSVFVYAASGITIPATQHRYCTDVAAGGIAGVFGATEEECFNVEIPATDVEYALKGGGSTITFILATDLAQGTVVLDVEGLPTPNSLEQLQQNYAALEGGVVEVSFS